MNDGPQPTDVQRIALRRIKELENGENPWFKPADAEKCVGVPKAILPRRL